MEGFGQEFTGRLDVGEQRNVVADGLPFLDVQFDADVAGDGDNVRWTVGGTTDGGIDNNGKFVLGDLLTPASERQTALDGRVR